MLLVNLIKFAFLFVLSKSATTANKCIWGIAEWNRRYNGLYSNTGTTFNGKTLYRQKQCIHGTEDRTPSHAYYTEEDGICLTSNINDPLQCTSWSQPQNIYSTGTVHDNECPDILGTVNGLTGIEIINYNEAPQVNGIYDVKIGKNMYRSKTLTNLYLIFDPYTFLWKFVTYSGGADSFISSSDPDQSCPVTTSSSNNGNWLMTEWSQGFGGPFTQHPQSFTLTMDSYIGNGGTATFSSYSGPPPTPLPTYKPTESLLAINEYNLIHPYPLSFYGDDDHKFDNEIYSKLENSDFETHPNYEERLTATLINMARLYPNEYKLSKYGGFSNYYTTQEGCGVAATKPYYYNTKMNEAARFHNYDSENCDGKSFIQEGVSDAHLTCDQPINRCELFHAFRTDENSDCWAHLRWMGFASMSPNDGLYISEEGICGGNGCYLDGHCGAVFNNDLNVLGIGKWRGSYGFDVLYGKDNNEYNYPIVYGSHLDNRYYWNSLNTETNKMTFVLQYYGVNIGNVNAQNVYLLYNNNVFEMQLKIGNSLSGFYEYTVDISSNSECEPYSFLVKTVNNDIYRLPENKKYYFGTALFTSYGKAGSFECNENHYYLNDNGVWKKNDGPLNKKINDNSECIGCDKIQSLQQKEF